MAAAARLPGIRIDAAPPPPDFVLPRMDVAVFVGFAATGPLHLPVAVESPAQYAAVFGADPALAWDAARGSPVTALLGPAVRAFFANGGLRCWVVRVARTRALEALWRGVDPADAPPHDLAESAVLPLPGVLALPAKGGPAEPAFAVARAPGSWADTLRASAALVATGVAIDHSAISPDGRAATLVAAGLKAGDLLLLGDPGAAGPRCYAAVDSVVATFAAGVPGVRAEIRLLGCFVPFAPAAAAGMAAVAGVLPAPVPATIEPAGAGARLRFASAAASALTPGHWARWTAGDTRVWLRIDAVGAGASRNDAILAGPAWRETEDRLPAAITRASVLTLDLGATAPDGVQRLGGVGLVPIHPGAWWTRQPVDDIYYRGTGADAAPRFPLAALPAEAPPRALIPLGVSALDGAAAPMLPATATKLERDGLSRFDAELFLDPALEPLGLETLIAAAEEIRSLNPVTRDLFGLHAALGVGAGGLYNEATLLAVPDAVQPGWTHGRESPPVVTPPPAVAPEAPIFAACPTVTLLAPVLTGPADPVDAGVLSLSWTSAGEGADYTVEVATQPGFADPHVVAAGRGTAADLVADTEGAFLYRVTARSGDAQAVSNIVQVIVRGADWTVRADKDYGAAGESGLRRVHLAALRLGAAGGDLFAALALPRHMRAADALRVAGGLRAGLGAGQEAALSYGALYHPWLVAPDGFAAPPDGAAVGLLAARALSRGAWVSPANQPFRDVVALASASPAGAAADLFAAQINVVQDAPRGFLAAGAATLSFAAGVSRVNVRRLMILLRRLALREGTAWVFEPNGDVLRRTVQRGLTRVLADLYQRGAFSGATEAESFALAAGSPPGPPTDPSLGRFTVEIRVAPALPLQFLTLRLADNGGAVAVTEGV